MAEIIINLDNSLYARGFDANERIHQKAFAKAENLIDRQLADARDFSDFYLKDGSHEDFIRYYNTISILGERGVGKTSFLMSLRHDYDYFNDGDGERGIKGKEIEMLPIIDPTLFEEKGHLFLLIITLVDDRVNKVKESGNIVDIEGYIREYDEIKAKLAQGLPTLDSVGMTYTEPQWHEDEYMMERGMESVKAAFYLERHFHLLVFYALKILHKKAFMLMLDDIDVDFKRGWMVLETLRKFLTTQQIIIVLSGNLKLYSKNVRKQQWKNFGKPLLMNERDRNDEGIKEYKRLVNEIEGQYLQKVLKSENRVFLYTMQDNILLNEDTYLVVKSDGDEKKSLEKVYSEVFGDKGISGRGEINIFTSFLMSTSIRTQIHFLKTTYAGEEENNILSEISAFASRVYGQNVDIDMATSEQRFNIILLRYLVDQRLIEEGYQLLPTFDSIDINSVLTSFSFIFAALYRSSPTLVFDYWCRIGFVRNNMHLLSYNDSRKDYVVNFCKGSGVFQSRDLKSIIGNGMAYMTYLLSHQSLDGAIPLMGFGFRAKGKKEEAEHRIDKVLENATGIQRLIGYTPLITLLSSNSNVRTLHYSVYSLLANIGQILKSDEKGINQAIRTACLPVSYQVQPDANQTVDTSTEDSEQEVDPKIDDESLNVLTAAFINWKQSFNEAKATYAPYLFGRIYTRFYFSLSNIVENNKDKKLGQIFNLFVASFINSCLIEEMKCVGQNLLPKININNVVTSTTILSNNIQNIGDVNLSFTKWIASCPLLYPFLSPSNPDNVKQFISCSCGDNKLPDALFTENGCMTTVLDKITWVGQKVILKDDNHQPKFSSDKRYISETIKLINDKGLDVNAILNGTNDQAKEELRPLFGNVSAYSLKLFRDKCKLLNRTIQLK